MRKIFKFLRQDFGGIRLAWMYENGAILSICERSDVQRLLVSSERLAFWLSATEMETLGAIPRLARKMNWLGGRISAKFSCLQAGVATVPNAMVIDTLRCGKPTIEGAYISISHSGHIMAATAAHHPIGVDAEVKTIAGSHSALMVLHAAELQRLQQVMGLTRDQAINLLWSCKEAFFKFSNANEFWPYARDLIVTKVTKQSALAYKVECIERSKPVSFMVYCGHYGNARVVFSQYA